MLEVQKQIVELARNHLSQPKLLLTSFLSLIGLLLRHQGHQLLGKLRPHLAAQSSLRSEVLLLDQRIHRRMFHLSSQCPNQEH